SPPHLLALVGVPVHRFYLATAGAVMPSLVPDEDLLVGNSLSAAAGTVLTFVGLVAGTQLADTLGTRGLLAITLACWPVSTFFALRGRARLPGCRAGRRPSGEARRG